jgi:hypothetical protein
MFTVKIWHSDGAEYDFEHIESIQYYSGGNVTVSGDEILTHKFPPQAIYYLSSKTSNFTHDGSNAVCTEFTKED